MAVKRIFVDSLQSPIAAVDREPRSKVDGKDQAASGSGT